MAQSLIVSVSGLQLRNLSDVIAAQAIDELLVLDSLSAYADQAEVALERAGALRADNPGLSLAFAVVPLEGQLPFKAPPKRVDQLVKAVGGRFEREPWFDEQAPALVVGSSAVADARIEAAQLARVSGNGTAMAAAADLVWTGAELTEKERPGIFDRLRESAQQAIEAFRGNPAAEAPRDQPLQRTQLDDAWALLQERAADADFAGLLQDVFGATEDQASVVIARLLEGPDQSLRLVVLSDEAMQGAQGGFSATGSDGQTPTVYLNSELWADGADPLLRERVMLEEIGAYIDTWINGSDDTAGDEGQEFVSRVLGEQLSADQLAAIRSDNDAGFVWVDGQRVVVENSAMSIVRRGADSTTPVVLTTNAGVLQYQVNISNAVGHGADLLVAAYDANAALIGWQVINRTTSFAANSNYNGTFNFAAAGINLTETSGITLRVWQGTAGTGYGTASNTNPAVTYRSTASVAGGTATGFNVNSTVAPTATDATNGALNLTGIITVGGAVASFTNVTVDTRLPATTATITAINDNVGIIQGVVTSGGRTDDTSVSLSGTLSAALQTGEALRIYTGTTLLGTATVTGTGWTFNDTRTLTNNQALTYTARVADVNGNLGTASAAYTATVDTAASARTARITAVADNVGPLTGTVALNGTTDDQTPTLSGTYSGTLATGDTIRIFNGTTLLGTATTNTANRTWTFTPTSLDAGSYSFISRVADQAGNLSATVANSTYAITISGGDTTAPVFTSATSASVNENVVAGTVVYTAAATDASALTYSLKPGVGDAASFAINATSGAVSISAIPNFETKASYTFTVVATDAQGNLSERIVGLNVSNVNEAATAISLSANTIAENTVIGTGVKIGDLSITDPDASGSNNVLTLEGADAASFQIRGTELFFVGTSPNFEGKPSYAVTVKSTDGSLTYSQGFTVNVSDVAEFTVSEINGSVSFAGDTSGPITIDIAADGSASFTRQGITATTTVSAIGTKVIGSDAETALVVVFNGTANADTFTINAPSVGDLTLQGNLLGGSDRLVLKVADIAGASAGQRILTLLTSGLTATDDTLVFDFADAADTVVLSSGSVISSFTTLEVKAGAVDIRLATVPDGLNVVINSGVVLTTAQFLALGSAESLSGLGNITINVASQAEYDQLAALIADPNSGLSLIGTATNINPAADSGVDQAQVATLTEAIAAITLPSFSFSETAGVISFLGSATGAITITVDAAGLASFAREGVTAANSVSGLFTKELAVTPGTTLDVDVTGTSADDSFRIDAPNAGAILFSGDALGGSDEFSIKVDDLIAGLNNRSLKVDTTGVTSGEKLSFIFDATAANSLLSNLDNDKITLTADSVITDSFTTLKVRVGKVDYSAATIPTNITFDVQSAIVLSYAQFTASNSFLSINDTGSLEIVLSASQLTDLSQASASSTDRPAAREMAGVLATSTATVRKAAVLAAV